MAKSNKRPKAVFSVSKLRKISDFILYVRTVILNIGNNALIFVTPAPALASVTTATNGLETAQVLAGTRVAGSVAARNIKYDATLKAAHGLLNYVQTLADNAADEAVSISIINSSGFGLRTAGTRIKAPLDAKNGKVSGNVNLVAKAAGSRVSYNWRKSADGLVWVDLPPTMQAKTVATGLIPATSVYFQCRAVTKTGAGNWSQTVSIVVQ